MCTNICTYQVIIQVVHLDGSDRFGTLTSESYGRFLSFLRLSAVHIQSSRCPRERWSLLIHFISKLHALDFKRILFY